MQAVVATFDKSGNTECVFGLCRVIITWKEINFNVNESKNVMFINKRQTQILCIGQWNEGVFFAHPTGIVELQVGI